MSHDGLEHKCNLLVQLLLHRNRLVHHTQVCLHSNDVDTTVSYYPLNVFVFSISNMLLPSARNKFENKVDFSFMFLMELLVLVG